jgi:hypothetical protein
MKNPPLPRAAAGFFISGTAAYAACAQHLPDPQALGDCGKPPLALTMRIILIHNID